MTATEVLRRLLDERGVEWKEHCHALAGSMAIKRETLWGQPIDNTNGKPIPHVYHCRATEMGDGRLFLEAQLVTPEQAIAATLGATDAKPTQAELSGTCHIDVRNGDWYCDGCGEMVGTCDPDSELCVDGNYVSMWNYCPNCGAKVVEPTTNDVDVEVEQ